MHLLTPAEVESLRARQALSPWADAAYRELVAKVEDPTFPCTFGTAALRKGDLLSTVVDTQAPGTPRQQLRQRFVGSPDRMRALDPVAASRHPLGSFLPPPGAVHTIPEYF